MDMGLGESLEWVTAYSKKRRQSLFWRVRAAVKKAVKNVGKQQLKFQYDPSSYALNFDDGCCHLGKGGVVNDSKLARLQDFLITPNLQDFRIFRISEKLRTPP
ncbi:hypothetical protein CFP56_038763 [Quercus suber]|uniref:Uncharacterized protein n=1 Tax=Quercus suber TaxID=58331 RepID=A0AAW0J1P3_QUESU